MASDKAYSNEQRLNALFARQPQKFSAPGGQLISSSTATALDWTSFGVHPATPQVTVGEWHVHGQVIGAPVASGGKINLYWGLSSSNAATSFRIWFQESVVNATPPGIIGPSSFTSMSSFQIGGTLGADTRVVIFDGMANVTTAGTLVLAAWTPPATNSWNVLYGSYLKIEPDF